jgi:glutamate-1-semialdehyde 2,1-aminomutase
LLSLGVYWPPAQFEAAFISAAHSDQDVDATLEAMKRAFAAAA